MTALRAAFQKAAQQAVAAFGDVGVSTNYHSYSTATYDASAGSITATYSTISGVTVVFTSFKVHQIDGQLVRPEDKMALIPALNLTSVTPKVEDRIVEDASVTWQVVRAGVDPAGALHKLQVRRP